MHLLFLYNGRTDKNTPIRPKTTAASSNPIFTPIIEGKDHSIHKDMDIAIIKTALLGETKATILIANSIIKDIL